ncbi:hypothetical protein Poly21_03320 [Allorhodopirellula heiligendammensis]|uniref:Uncharacterized protein n=2 Tax=Allorhodopirellula heiligendammensis TaxID=2714739 RepID=A0A5C6C2F0_9BACT|nr:hypothetical protein Poly21_03320 [Allorhodopirellula heiligendammensis]
MIGYDQPTFQSMRRIDQARRTTRYQFRITGISADEDVVRLSGTDDGVALSFDE